MGNDSSIFAGCSNLGRISASPDTQPVMLSNASLTGMFASSGFNSPLSWNLSNVGSLSSMFSMATSFNELLNFTNMQSVRSMDSMFNGARNFNRTVTFQTGGVQSMNAMFQDAISFNQPVNFNTSNVTDMTAMFRRAKAFNQPVNMDGSPCGHRVHV